MVTRPQSSRRSSNDKLPEDQGCAAVSAECSAGTDVGGNIKLNFFIEISLSNFSCKHSIDLTLCVNFNLTHYRQFTDGRQVQPGRLFR